MELMPIYFLSIISVVFVAIGCGAGIPTKNLIRFARSFALNKFFLTIKTLAFPFKSFCGLCVSGRGGATMATKLERTVIVIRSCCCLFTPQTFESFIFYNFIVSLNLMFSFALEQFEIFYSVIGSIFVNVVNNFRRFKASSNMFFHYNSMLEFVSYKNIREVFMLPKISNTFFGGGHYYNYIPTLNENQVLLLRGRTIWNYFLRR